MNTITLVHGTYRLRAWQTGILQQMLKKGLPYAIALGKMPRRALVDDIIIPNLVVTAGKQLVGDILIAVAANPLTYHAIGTGTTAPADTDVQLETEVMRKAFASRSRSGTTITLSAFYLADDCTYFIKEIGVFGDAASVSPNSGTLLSRALESYDNSDGTYDLTFDYSLTIG